MKIKSRSSSIVENNKISNTVLITKQLIGFQVVSVIEKFLLNTMCRRSRGDPKKLLLVSVIYGGKETKAKLRIEQCDDAWQICVGMYRPRIVPGVLSVTCD
ncbi:hypothetical protein WN51_06437 [Melipona quadrifasciata]|uniref:Uncharacterized protein n=1 Tax=Melipona quadrifasciata TaxID=166423 RepID=A0A0M9A9K3_9HYME|nr:hypothetical protein WN51_06437 [Melipona quadrifasciata]